MNSLTWQKHLDQWEQFLLLRRDSAEDDGVRIRANRQLRAIECVRYAAVQNPKLLSEFIAPQHAAVETTQVDNYFFDLNDAQKAAVSSAISGQLLSLIQGPPGTGKTQVIAEICLHVLAGDPDVRILVCSETHVAVNNLITRIVRQEDMLKVLRIRDKEMDDSTEPFSPKRIIEDYLEWLKENGDIRAYEIVAQFLSEPDDPSIERDLALSANIIGMTCNRIGAYDFEVFSDPFDLVIIDEVCKATLPEILMPLIVAKKAVLVGDPKQLPPVFCSEEADIIRSIDSCDLRRYMYIDELFKASSGVVVLDTQYRMSDQIGTFISDTFYKGALKNGRGEDVPEGLIWIDYEPSHDWPVLSEDGGETQEINNLDECRIVCSILRQIDTRFSEATSVAIIAPYRSQIRNLRQHLAQEQFAVVSYIVDTVDGFQGKESDVVVFSLTRTCGSYRFLADERRLNVALSRARDHIVIVGCSAYARKNDLLNKVMGRAHTVNMVAFQG